jgi:phage gp46-like protein
MTDIRIVWSPELMSGDWLLVAPVLDTGRALATAAAVAIFTHRTARRDDPLPGGPDDTNRRGWWGDHEAREIHDAPPIGCRTWLLSREKQLPQTRARAEIYIREALDEQLVRPGVVEGYDLVVEWFRPQHLGCEITFHRGPEGSIAVRFERLWDQLTDMRTP